MDVSIISPINDLGYGYTGLHIVDELMNLGHKVCLFPIGQPACHPRHAVNIKQALANSDTFDVTAPCIRLWHQHDMSMFVGHSKHIGFPIFELDTFTEQEKHHLSSCDELFVCSTWAKNTVLQQIKNNIYDYEMGQNTHVIPLGVDTSIFTPKKSTRKPTIFLNIGKWEIRKGHDILVDMFNYAFNPSDNVELWMMCHNGFLKPEEQKAWEDRYRNTRLGDKIRFIPRVDTDVQVAEIMQQADCGVFPSRAEGWNLEALEMMACGKDVIITNYSAHRQFCTTANSYLVSIDEVEPAFDGKWFFGQGNWAKLTTEHLQLFARHMVQVHEEKQEYGMHLNEQGIETANYFTWRKTAETIVKHLN